MIIKTSYPFMKPPPSARLIRGHRLAQGLVFFLPFGEAGGLQVFDLSENGNDVTLQGNPLWVAGKFGSCILCDGTGDYIEEDKKIVSDYPFTVVNWFMCTSGQGGVNFSIVDKSEIDVRYLVYISTGTGQLNLFVTNTVSYSVASAATYDDGIWHQTVGVFKSDTEKLLYIDGIYEGIVTDSVTFSSEVDRWSIGHSGDFTPSGDFTGKLGNTSLYNRGLSAGEIAELYWRPFCMFERRARTALMSGYEVVVPPEGIVVLRRRRESA